MTTTTNEPWPIHYRSDFDFLLRFADDDGNLRPFPDYDFVVTLLTNGPTYIASFIGGVMTNLYNDDGVIHIVADNHKLWTGPLRLDFEERIPDDTYPDGIRSTFDVIDTGIVLTTKADGHSNTGIVVDVGIIHETNRQLMTEAEAVEIATDIFNN